MSDKSTRRKFLKLAGTGSAVALAGCSGNNAPDESTATETETSMESGGDSETETEADTETAEPSQGGTLRLASPGPVQTLDPINAKGSGAGYNQYQQSLLFFPDGDLPPQPMLAEDWEISNGGRTYTFQLKEGVSFHDGQEMTAQDWVYSWRRLAESSNSRNADDIVGSTFTIAHETETVTQDGEETSRIVPDTLAVEAVDDYTFRFTLEQAFHGALDQIAGGAFGVIPENSVGDIEGYDGEYSYNEFFSTAGDGPQFASTGPFQVDSWSKGDQIVLTAFDDYHGQGPNLDEITYTVINQEGTRYRRFVNDNLDVIESIPTSQFSPDNRSIESDEGAYRTGTYDLGNGETVNYGEATGLSTEYLVFNCQRTPLPVRRAFAHLINQHAIARDVYKGLPEPAYHITPPPVFMTREDESPPEIYDRHAQEGFRSELEFSADGWPYGYDETQIDEATRIMEESDLETPYEVEFTVISGRTDLDQISQRLRDKAQAAGITVNIVKADFGTVISNALNGSMDMFTLSDGMEWPESDNFLRFFRPYDPDNVSGMFTRWTFEDQSRYTDLMERARETWDEVYAPNTGPGQENQLERNGAYYVMEEVNWQSVQELPVTHPVSQRLWDTDVNLRMYGTMENQTFDSASVDR